MLKQSELAILVPMSVADVVPSSLVFQLACLVAGRYVPLPFILALFPHLKRYRCVRATLLFQDMGASSIATVYLCRNGYLSIQRSDCS
jgi:hypothetical protein